MIAKTIIIFLMTLSLGVTILFHGEVRNPSNAWKHLIQYVIGVSLLYCAGFFDDFLL